MAWGFNAVCPDCGHNWEGIETSMRFGPHLYGTENCQTLFCPHCSMRVHLPRVLDRKSWRHWYERFLPGSQYRTEWVLSLLAHIDAGFTSCGWYTPLPVDPGMVSCCSCQSPMVPCAPGEDYVGCPLCKSLRPVPRVYRHISLGGPSDGFG
jgi:hypothetical protein